MPRSPTTPDYIKHGMQLHYQIQGHGQTLLLLHGLFGSADNWNSIARPLAQHFQVVTVDLRNHGRSAHAASQTYAEMAEDVLTLCDAQGWSRIHLLGHSLGGKVAMQLAAQVPHRLEKLIVVDMSMRAYADVHTHLIDAMLALDLTRTHTRSSADKALADSIPNQMLRQFLLTNLIKGEHGLQWRLNLSALKANYPHLQSAVCRHSHYAQPCLFIRGEHSDYITPQDMTEIQQHFTQAQFVSLPTGHWVHAEQPTQFVQTVKQFLHGDTDCH